LHHQRSTISFVGFFSTDIRYSNTTDHIKITCWFGCDWLFSHSDTGWLSHILREEPSLLSILWKESKIWQNIRWNVPTNISQNNHRYLNFLFFAGRKSTYFPSGLGNNSLTKATKKKFIIIPSVRIRNNINIEIFCYSVRFGHTDHEVQNNESLHEYIYISDQLWFIHIITLTQAVGKDGPSSLASFCATVDGEINHPIGNKPKKLI
jgi:hypothetical protein